MYNLAFQMLAGVRKRLITVCLLLFISNVSAAERPGLVLQVSEDDPKIWHMVLNIAKNAPNNSEQPLDVKVVAFGPGLKMLAMDSRVANRLYTAINNGVTFLACGMTMKKLKIKDDQLYDKDHIKRVDGGVIEIMRLQKAGWTYIRP